MKTKIVLLSTSLMLVLLIQSCSLPGLAPTEAVPTQEVQTPGDSLTTEVPGVMPLPSGLAVVPSPSLILVDFQDELNGWGTSERDGIFLLRTQDGGATWLDVTPPGILETSYYPRLFLLDVNTAWALFSGGDFYTGTLYHTTDGGATWTSNPVPFSWGDLQFLDASTGLILADRGAGAGSNAVELFQTSDGGLSWTSIFHNDPSQPDSSDSLPLGGMKSGATFLDADTGWVTGSRPMEGDIYLFITRDGGRSWNLQPIPIPPEKADCQFNTFPPIFFGQDGFLPILLYFPSGPVQQVFYVTHDGGTTWTADPTNPDQVIVPAGQYSFADALNGFSWNGGPTMLLTTDGGVTWFGGSTDLNLEASLGMIDFIDGNIGWALTGPDDTGQSGLFHTTDAGGTWSQLIP